MTADVFSSMYPLVISRLYLPCVASLECPVFHCLGVHPTVGKQGGPQAVGAGGEGRRLGLG